MKKTRFKTSDLAEVLTEHVVEISFQRIEELLNDLWRFFWVDILLAVNNPLLNICAQKIDAFHRHPVVCGRIIDCVQRVIKEGADTFHHS